MERIEWTKDLETGIASIDEQHQQLVKLVNEFHAYRHDDTREAMNIILRGLFEYTSHHFAYEEELFERFDFSEQEAHAQEHERFKEKVRDLQHRFEEDETISPEEISSFLQDWIQKHIKGSDRDYIELLLECGVK